MPFLVIQKWFAIFSTYKKYKLFKSGSLYGKHISFVFFKTTLLDSTKKSNSYQLPHYSSRNGNML